GQDIRGKDTVGSKEQRTSEEKTQLSLLVDKTSEEKTQLEVKNKELSLLLDKTSEEKTQLSLLLNNERLSILWGLCDKSTLQCSRCLPGWTEHASRCFFLSHEQKKWEDARRECIGVGGDLAIVLNAADQAFLTKMTYDFTQQNPLVTFHSAWIGLQDMVKEGVFFWTTGGTVRWNVRYWRPQEPNNAVASWDHYKIGQDCVGIVPPKKVGGKGWLNSWDDIVCGGLRHYLCETDALILN
uniref:C-type lectin domain-containing protein n=1 Tax=Dicentrarchus labrax TaxID=13489 RepID=A0A8P4KA70_DICLA